jgi:hypothetical protein
MNRREEEVHIVTRARSWERVSHDEKIAHMQALWLQLVESHGGDEELARRELRAAFVKSSPTFALMFARTNSGSREQN